MIIYFSIDHLELLDCARIWSTPDHEPWWLVQASNSWPFSLYIPTLDFCNSILQWISDWATE